MDVLPAVAEKPRYVNRMFARIAPTYDLMNRLITAGQDQRWRNELLDLADLPPHGSLLDIGAGTGDIAAEAVRRFPGAQVIAADFTYEMLVAGRHKAAPGRLALVQGDTLRLPFADNSFDAVVSGFLIRNLGGEGARVAAFREQVRVAKPGGRVICLEITPPTNSVLGPLFQFYFFNIVPWLGALISGDADAYRYLPHSTIEFPSPSALRHTMELAGLQNVFFRERMFRSIAIHVGSKIGTDTGYRVGESF